MDEVLKEYGMRLLVNEETGVRMQLVSIIGEIEGHESASSQTKTTKYEHMLPILASLEQSDKLDGILFLINTVGGDVSCGLALAEMIAGLSKPTVALVVGDSHSIGVPLSVAADYTVIAPSATVIIHPVRMSGMVLGAPQTYEYLAGMQERIVSFVTSHSRISRGYYTRLMSDTCKLANDVGTILSGEEAVQCGLIDQMGTLSDALEYLKKAADA